MKVFLLDGKEVPENLVEKSYSHPFVYNFMSGKKECASQTGVALANQGEGTSAELATMVAGYLIKK